MSKLLYLSMIIAIVVIPVRMSRRPDESGPRRAVSIYAFACLAYFFVLAFVVQRLV